MKYLLIFTTLLLSGELEVDGEKLSVNVSVMPL